MDLQFELENLDDVDESLHEAYTETDGKFTLNVKGAVPKGKLDLTNRKLRDAEKSNRKLKETVTVIESIGTLEEVQGLPGRISELEAQLAAAGGNGGPEIEKLKQQYEEKYGDRLKTLETQLGQATKDRDEAQSKLGSRMLDSGVKKVARKLHIEPEWDDWVESLIEARRFGVEEGGDPENPEDIVVMRAGKVLDSKKRIGEAMSAEEFLEAQIDQKPALVGESGGADAKGGPRRVAGRRVVPNDPVALGKAAADVAAGKATVERGT